MIQSVQRAAQILGVLGSGTPRLGVTEIADRLGLAKPTVHGLLRTLEAHELIAQDPETGKYSLGPGVLQLGNAYLDGSELRVRSLRWAESLARQADEAVWVATLSGSRVIVLHHVFRPDDTVQILEVGAAIPWHACALGHAIVASLPASQRAAALAADLAPLTGRTKTTPPGAYPRARPGARRRVRGRGRGGHRRRRGHRRPDPRPRRRGGRRDRRGRRGRPAARRAPPAMTWCGPSSRQAAPSPVTSAPGRGGVSLSAL